MQEPTKVLKDEFDFYFSTIQIEIECVDIDNSKNIDITRKGEENEEKS